jgi:hypothetical protein
MSTKRFPRSLRLVAYVFAVASVWMCAGCSNSTSTSGSDGGSLDATSDLNVPTDSAPRDSTTTDTSSCPTGQTSCGGACVDVSSDPTNCGTCGSTCGTGLVCSNGTCALSCGDSGALTQCGAGCYDTQTDSNNCGTCGNACTVGQSCVAGVCKQGCGSGSTLCGSQCVDELTDNANCGACSNACVSGTVCSGGTCKITCGGGLSLCSDDAGSECKDLHTDSTNCGSCGSKCASDSVCSAGGCTNICPAGTVDCGGGCVDPATSSQHCGASGGCGADGGSPGTLCATGLTCVSGVCSLICPPGLTLCGGTCIDPTTNNTYCGAASDCSGAITCTPGTVCTGSVCKTSCNPGQIICNGVCVDPNTNLTFCGATSNCAGANAGTQCPPGDVCTGGACRLTCSPGLVNCNGSCIDPNTNTTFCGASGTCVGSDQGSSCQAGYMCSQGVCALQCQAGLVDCNSVCINPLTDRNYCGASGSCSTLATQGTVCVAGQVCTGGNDAGVASTCQLSCKSTEVECNGSCIDPTTDSFFCGATPGGTCNDVAPGANYQGVNCSGNTGTKGSTCVSGACTCPGGDVICGTSCIDPTTSNTNCGAKPPAGPNTGGCSSAVSSDPNYAGQTCGPLSQCGPGPDGPTCLSTCTGGGTQCNLDGGGTPYCANTVSDNNNCGSCGNPCPALTTCGLDGGVGACNSTCSPGQTACPGAVFPNPTNPYCAALATDTNNCGAAAADGCGHVCTSPLLCSNGTCVSSCSAPDNTFCPGPPAQCSDTTTDNANCGACGSVCATNNCVSSVCCPPGATQVCGGSCSNGNTDPNNCGACGTVCTGLTPACLTGTSSPAAPACGVCDPATSVLFNGHCYYLDGSAGVCDAGYLLQSNATLTTILAANPNAWQGKTYKHTTSGNCCVETTDATEEFGMTSSCNHPVVFGAGEPVVDGTNCNGSANRYAAQLTLCGF